MFDIINAKFTVGVRKMIDYDKWDEYYDGGFASDEPTDRFWEEYDSTLEYNRFEYGGQKINVTVKQIMQDMRVKAISDKFLYVFGILSTNALSDPKNITIFFMLQPLLRQYHIHLVLHYATEYLHLKYFQQ